jgi:hypothetical protein
MGTFVYIEVWFNAEKKFGVKLRGDDSINVYAYLPAYEKNVRVSYVIHRGDGRIEDEQVYRGLTRGEKTLIREMADIVSMEETGKSVESNWFGVFCDVYR